MASRRVVITGLGIVSSQGSNLTEVWSALREGRSAIGPVQSVDTSKLRFHNAAEARDFDPGKHLTGSSLDLMDRFAQFAVVAAQQAISQSGLEITAELSPKMAVVTGSCIGGQSSQDAGFTEVYLKGLNRVHPLTIPRTMPNAGASHISMRFGIRGPAFTVSTACSSANHAIGQAFWMVRNGQAEAAITGGSEAPLSFGMLKAWEAMRVVSPDTCRPFALGRPGMVLGEGGAMMVIEPLERASARGARILGEFVGFGMSSDAGHITSPSIEGPAAAMRSALEDAGLAPEQIGYINAHGTGTPGNDVTECRAIRKLFGSHADRLLVSSTKSMHGHALGAAGALEAAATIMALRKGIIPPTANMTTQDPECDLDVVPNQAREAQVEYALSNSFAFGGLNAVVGIRRWQS